MDAVVGMLIMLGVAFALGIVILILELVIFKHALPFWRKQPKGTLWRSPNLMFFSQVSSISRCYVIFILSGELTDFFGDFLRLSVPIGHNFGESWASGRKKCSILPQLNKHGIVLRSNFCKLMEKGNCTE